VDPLFVIPTKNLKDKYAIPLAIARVPPAMPGPHDQCAAHMGDLRGETLLLR